MNDFRKLCENCSHQGCCTRSASPLVFSDDLKKLETVNNDENKFTQFFTIKGKKFRGLVKKKNSDICIFWDEDTKQCTVYDKRPFECRAFPFSLEKVNGKYYWTIYSCNQDADWQWTEEYLQNLENDPQFDEIMQNIEYFVLHPETTVSEYKEYDYTIIREVNYKKQQNTEENIKNLASIQL